MKMLRLNFFKPLCYEGVMFLNKGMFVLCSVNVSAFYLFHLCNVQPQVTEVRVPFLLFKSAGFFLRKKRENFSFWESHPVVLALQLRYDRNNEQCQDVGWPDSRLARSRALVHTRRQTLQTWACRPAYENFRRMQTAFHQRHSTPSLPPLFWREGRCRDLVQVEGKSEEVAGVSLPLLFSRSDSFVVGSFRTLCRSRI